MLKQHLGSLVSSCLPRFLRVGLNPPSSSGRRWFHASTPALHIMRMTRLRVVDNSELGKQAMLEGKPPKCIGIYKRVQIGNTGDRIIVAIKGQKKKAVIVGCKGKLIKPLVPRFDTNNIVLVDEDNTPLGTRILAPIPHSLRAKGEYSKLIAIATRFV